MAQTAADTFVRARIDSDTKERASAALRAMGLTVSDSAQEQRGQSLGEY